MVTDMRRKSKNAKAFEEWQKELARQETHGRKYVKSVLRMLKQKNHLMSETELSEKVRKESELKARIEDRVKEIQKSRKDIAVKIASKPSPPPMLSRPSPGYVWNPGLKAYVLGDPEIPNEGV